MKSINRSINVITIKSLACYIKLVFLGKGNRFVKVHKVIKWMNETVAQLKWRQVSHYVGEKKGNYFKTLIQCTWHMKFLHRNSFDWNANMLTDCCCEKSKSQGFGKGMGKLQWVSIYHSQQDWFTGSSHGNFFVLNLYIEKNRNIKNYSVFSLLLL